MKYIKAHDFYLAKINPHFEKLSRCRNKIMSALECSYDAAESLLCGEMQGQNNFEKNYVRTIQEIAAVDCGFILEY